MTAPDVLVGATFTARPLEGPLTERGVGRVEFAPYNQLPQWLLTAPAASGQVAVILVRMADLIRRDAGPDHILRPLLRERAEACADALRAYCGRQTSKPFLLLIPSPGERAGLFDAGEDAFRALDCVRPLAWTPDLSAGSRLFDPIADKLGHIPFTADGFAALAAMVMGGIEACSGADEPVPTPLPIAGGLAAFLSKLRLRVACRSVREAESLAGAAKLCHTAVTFHATGKRHTAEDLRGLLVSGEVVALSVTVADKFGDYGAMGLILIEPGEIPVVRELVLSCVVLGKQVEHCLIHALAADAEQAGISALAFDYAAFEGNEPVVDFLSDLCRTGGGMEIRHGDGRRSTVPTAGLRRAALALAVSSEAVERVRVEIPRHWWEAAADVSAV